MIILSTSTPTSSTVPGSRGPTTSSTVLPSQGTSSPSVVPTTLPSNVPSDARVLFSPSTEQPSTFMTMVVSTSTPTTGSLTIPTSSTVPSQGPTSSTVPSRGTLVPSVVPTTVLIPTPTPSNFPSDSPAFSPFTEPSSTNIIILSTSTPTSSTVPRRRCPTTSSTVLLSQGSSVPSASTPMTILTCINTYPPEFPRERLNNSILAFINRQIHVRRAPRTGPCCTTYLVFIVLFFSPSIYGSLVMME
jgi:hypothetical protein